MSARERVIFVLNTYHLLSAHIREDLATSVTPDSVEPDKVESLAKRRMKNFKPVLNHGKRLRKAKGHQPGQLGKVRETATGDLILMTELADQDLQSLNASWNADIAKMNIPAQEKGGHSFWQCSNTLVGQGPKHMDGTML